MRVLCAVVARRLAATDPGGNLPTLLARHAGGCLRCQAERARERRLRRELAALGSRTGLAPRGLGRSVGAVVTGAHRPPAVVALRARESTMRRIAASGALAGVAAFAAGGAVFAAWRLVKRPA